MQEVWPYLHICTDIGYVVDGSDMKSTTSDLIFVSGNLVEW